MRKSPVPRTVFRTKRPKKRSTHVIYYDRENRLIRDFAKLSEINSNSVREFLIKTSKGASKGTSKVCITTETPFSITFHKVI